MEFTIDLIVDYWEILQHGVTDPVIRDRFDGIVRPYDSGRDSVSPDARVRIKQIAISFDRRPVGPSIPFSPTDVPVEVELLGDPEVRRSVSATKETAIFGFADGLPTAELLTGVQLSHLLPEERVRIRVRLLLVDHDGRRLPIEKNSGPMRANREGTVGFDFTVITSRPDDRSTQGSIVEVEQYFNARRYLFTRLLLLSIEREQLVDLVEALMLRASIEFPDAPDLGGHVGGGIRLPPEFVSRKRSVAAAVAETTV